MTGASASTAVRRRNRVICCAPRGDQHARVQLADGDDADRPAAGHLEVAGRRRADQHDRSRSATDGADPDDLVAEQPRRAAPERLPAGLGAVGEPPAAEVVAQRGHDRVQLDVAQPARGEQRAQRVAREPAQVARVERPAVGLRPAPAQERQPRLPVRDVRDADEDRAARATPARSPAPARRPGRRGARARRRARRGRRSPARTAARDPRARRRRSGRRSAPRRAPRSATARGRRGAPAPGRSSASSPPDAQPMSSTRPPGRQQALRRASAIAPLPNAAYVCALAS